MGDFFKMNARELIALLELEPLPEEGGFYRETFRDTHRIPAAALATHASDRALTTCIYYLITPQAFSGLHAVCSTELFHFYLGDPVRMVQLTEQGALTEVTIGSDLEAGQRPQVVVPPDVWQGTRLLPGGRWALLGCQVSPGFEFEDFRGGSYDELASRFPAHAELVRQYTRR